MEQHRGTNGSELPHLVALGMTPLQAIEGATATGPRTLGPQAPHSGVLAAGCDADLITVDGDPLADISVRVGPARITGVWTRGRQVKGA
jgi:imidazolonepropionase-like amidohydrolase